MTIREQERRQAQRKASLTQPDPFSRHNGRRVMSFRAWCDLNNFSIPTGRRIIAAGEGPKITQLGERRIGIREDHNAEWQDSRIIGE